MDRNVSAQLEVTFIVCVLEAASDEVGHREPGVVRVLIGVLHPALLMYPPTVPKNLVPPIW